WRNQLVRKPYTPNRFTLSPWNSVAKGISQPFSQTYFRKGQNAVQHYRPVSSVAKPKVLKLKPTNFQAARDEDEAYSWGYRWFDEFGTQMFREETSDGRGTVRGRYSFRDAKVSTSK